MQQSRKEISYIKGLVIHLFQLSFKTPITKISKALKILLKKKYWLLRNSEDSESQELSTMGTTPRRCSLNNICACLLFVIWLCFNCTVTWRKCLTAANSKVLDECTRTHSVYSNSPYKSSQYSMCVWFGHLWAPSWLTLWDAAWASECFICKRRSEECSALICERGCQTSFLFIQMPCHFFGSNLESTLCKNQLW